ncbi:MAG: 50S ribosomal protein L10 [Clostridia bacterium]
MNNLELKKLVVDELKNKLKKAKSVAFIDYRGVTVDEETALRCELRNNGGEYKVFKNRLIMRALKDININGFNLEGTTAVVFSYNDEVTALKCVSNAIEKTKKLAITCGVFNNKFADAQMMKMLSLLPSKQVLIAQLLGVLNGPIKNLAYVISTQSK